MVSVVISWCDRNEIEVSIAHFIKAVAAVNGELIIINYAGNGQLLDRYLGGYRNMVRVITVSGEKYFNKACSNNIGGFMARFEYIFFCDCDIILKKDTIQSLYKKVTVNPVTFATLAKVTESVKASIKLDHILNLGYELKIVTADKRTLKIINHQVDSTSGTRSAPGLVLVKKSHLELVNGFNSALTGWGWEDMDLICRLVLGANLKRIVQGKAIHLSHGDDARVKKYSIKDRWISRDNVFRECLKNYDANNFKGTLRQDIAKLQSKISSSCCRQNAATAVI